MTQSTPQTGISLKVTKTIKAPRERVFAALTQPELPHQWWGAHESFSAPIAEVDLKVGGKSPFETREQPRFDTFKFHRRLIGSDNQLLSVLVKMVENMEENILSFFLIGKVVNIVNQQHIYHLIEMDKVVLTVVSDRIDKLIDKLLAANVKHGLFGKIIFYFNSNCLKQV
jgi:hypothetical protein